MNSIIIFATAIILKKEIKIFRMLFSSFIGAIYACIYYISNMEIYSNIFLKVILSFVIIYIAFNSKTIKEFARELLIFYLTSFTFGGVTFAMLYFISPGEILFQNRCISWYLSYKNDINWRNNRIFYNNYII